MKLSWQELHFRLMPRKICAVFCAACMRGRLAGVDRAAPVDADQEAAGIAGSAGLSSLRDELVVRQIGLERVQQPRSDALAPAVSE